MTAVDDDAAAATAVASARAYVLYKQRAHHLIHDGMLDGITSCAFCRKTLVLKDEFPTHDDMWTKYKMHGMCKHCQMKAWA